MYNEKYFKSTGKSTSEFGEKLQWLIIVHQCSNALMRKEGKFNYTNMGIHFSAPSVVFSKKKQSTGTLERADDK